MDIGYKKFIRDGDIYVRITSKPSTLQSLYNYNLEKYGRLEWPNPRKDTPFPFTKKQLESSILVNAIKHKYETGLLGDMLTDLSHLLREDNSRNPINMVKIN